MPKLVEILSFFSRYSTDSCHFKITMILQHIPPMVVGKEVEIVFKCLCIVNFHLRWLPTVWYSLRMIYIDQ